MPNSVVDAALRGATKPSQFAVLWAMIQTEVRWAEQLRQDLAWLVTRRPTGPSLEQHIVWHDVADEGVECPN